MGGEVVHHHHLPRTQRRGKDQLEVGLENYEGLSESLLVFSEEGYHKLLSDSFSWSNIVQLNSLRESTCLLIGLSLTDPNLRRLLDTAAQKTRSSGPRHYVFLKRLAGDSLGFHEGDSALRSEVVQEVVSAHHNLLDKSYRDLGLNVVWVEQYEEIPHLLRRIRRVST